MALDIPLLTHCPFVVLGVVAPHLEDFSHTWGGPPSGLRIVLERPGLGFHASAAQRAMLWRFWWGAGGQACACGSPGPGAADGDGTGSPNSNNNCHPPYLAHPALWKH